MVRQAYENSVELNDPRKLCVYNNGRELLRGEMSKLIDGAEKLYEMVF